MFGSSRIVRLCLAALLLAPASVVQAALSITPLTWDIVGLDSNSPATGPRHFPVGARVCSTVATTNVAVTFAWDSANANVNLRPGSLSSLTLPSLAAGGCGDAYFEVEVTPVAAAYDSARRYHITATDFSGSISTPQPRELYVEHLVSQNRNSITNVRYGPNVASLVSVAPGAAMNLVVGNTYVIELSGGTATQGYEQLEGFINFTNTIFQILAVQTTYSANTSVYVSSPSDKLYADACGWEPDPNSPDYRACVGTPGKTGGSNIVTRYTLRIIGGGGTSQTLNSMLYDFSGSSFHYNADYGVGARIANIIDPASAGIAKAFSPNPATVNGVSALTITLTNPNAGAVSGYAFVDALPANMTIATPANAVTSGCGTPTLTATPGTQTIQFANGTVAAAGTCTIKVDITASTTGTFVNTTQNLFVGGIDTGLTATASLLVNNDPPPGTGICGQTLARWNFATGFSVSAPAPTIANVAASAAAGAGITPNAQTSLTADGTSAWGSNGGIATGATLVTANNDYFEFALNTTGITQVFLSFDAQRRSANGPQGLAVFWGTTNTRPETGTSIFSNATALPTQNTTVSFGAGNSIGVTSGLNPAGNTFFRIYAFNAGNSNPGSDPVIDNVLFTSCGAGVKPTLTKAFAPDPIAVGATSTLTFTLTNTNAAALTGAHFTDALPAGVQVAAAPAATTTCAGTPTWAPAAGSTSLTFGSPAGGTIPASGSCTVSVNVTATAAGTHSNVSGFLSTTETGTTTTSVATDTLTALLPPTIAKRFAPSPILAGGVSTLTFTLTNPNPDHPISGVAFTDNLPAAPGIMRVAATPNAATSGCGAPAFAPAAAATSVSSSGGTITAGGSCVVRVDVTAPAAGDYANVSGNVSHVVNAATVNGGTASATLSVVAPAPAIGLLKEIAPTASGPWSGYLAVALPTDVFYRFTVENLGSVALSPVSVADPLVPAAAGCSWPPSLPVADAFDDDHIATCVVGPVAAGSGVVINTATASGTFGGNTVTDQDSARHAEAALSLAKSASPTTYTAAGETISYSFVVTNTGVAILDGPITVLDNQTLDESCPALTTVGDLDAFFDPGEQIVCTATHVTTAGDVTAGSIVNVASATNGVVTSPSAMATVTLVGPQLTTTKSASPMPFVVGVPAFYTITVTNTGTAATDDAIVVSDTLPPGIAVSGASGTGWSCNVVSSTVTCTMPAPLAVGATSSAITVTVTVTAAAISGNNSATASGGGDPTCPDAPRCTGIVLVAVTAPVLTITKGSVLRNDVVPPSGQSDPGDVIDYTLTVVNSGDGPAEGVVVSDPLLATLSCTIGAVGVTQPLTLAAGATLVCTGSHTLTAGDVGSGSVTNTATVAANNVCNPTTPGSTCTDSALTPLGTVPVLTTSKAGVLDDTVVAPSDQSNPGDTIAYTITVTNSGNAPANGVIVSDPLLALACTIGAVAVTPPVTLNAGASLVCSGTHVLNTTDIANGSVANTATTTATNVCNPTTPGSTCGASETTPLTLRALLATSKSAILDNGVVAPSDQSNPGDTIAYTITVANSGNGAASGVSVDDPLLPALSCTIGAATVTLPTTLNAGAALVCSGSYTLTAADIGNGTVVNNATTSGGNVCNPISAGSTCTATTTTPLALLAVLSTSKAGTLDNSVVAPANQSDVGDTIAYTITVVNSGNGAATGVDVIDPRLAAIDCTIASVSVALPTTLNAGASLVCTGTYVLAAVDIGTGSVANTATTSATNVCNPTTVGSTCSASENTPLTLLPALTTSKDGVLDNTIVPPSSRSDVGDAIAYTITVVNSGNGAAAGVNVNDPLLPALACTIGAATATLPATLDAGASLICTGTYTLTAADIANGSVDNTATTTATNVCNPTTVGSTCSTTTNTPLVLQPTLTIAKTGTLDNAVVPPSNQSDVGDTIAYTITVANSGNGAATGVSVSDPRLPVLTCTIGAAAVTLPTTLNAGASLVCTGTYVLTAADIGNGSVSNTATTSATNVCNPTTTGSTCSTTQVTPLGQVPALATTKSGVLDDTVVAPNNQSNAGDTIIYTITVANSGTAAATGVTISDPRLATLTCTIGASTVTLPTTLNAGASLICTGTYVLTATDITNASVVNTATTTATNVCNPTSAGSTCSATTTTPLTLRPVLTTAKVGTLDNTVVPPSNQSDVGDAIAYTITVANSGNGVATGVSVSDPRLPVLTCTIGAATVTLPVTLDAGASLVCTGTYVLTATDIGNGVVDNTATVSAGNVCNPVTTGSTCSDTETTPLGMVPNLTVDKSHAGNFMQGQVGATFSLLVSNIGSGPTSGEVSIVDTLPAGLTATAIAGAGWTCTLATLTCTRSDALAAGASYPPIVLTVDVAANAASALVNTATVSGGGDTTPGNNSDDDPIAIDPVGGAPDLTVDKSHSGSFVRGQPGGIYTLVISNVGTAATSGPVSVVDTLPVGLTATSITGAGWTCTLATLTCTRGDALAIGASYPPITIAVTVAADAPESLVNNAVVSGGGDATPGNNTDGDITPILAGEPAQAIPVDGMAMLILLALIVLASGAWMASMSRR